MESKRGILPSMHDSFLKARLCFGPAKLPPNRKVEQTHGQKVAAKLEGQQRHAAKLARRAPQCGQK